VSTVEEIKAAAAGLTADEQLELFRWWTQTESFKTRQLEALKRDLARGLEDLEHGRYHTYDDSNVLQLANEEMRLLQSRKRR
jgi:hypothetical protein